MEAVPVLEEKMVHVSFFPEGFAPDEKRWIPITPEEEEALKKPENRQPYSGSYLAILVANKAGYERVTVPQILENDPEERRFEKIHKHVTKTRPAKKADDKFREIPTFYIGGNEASI